MTEEKKLDHPKICFGISRHNVIIPLKVVNVKDFEDGCLKYDFAINHPNPSQYMETHYRADFEEKYVSADRPLCDEFTKIRLTIAEAKELITKQLRAERAAAMMKVNGIDKSLAKIDTDIAELEAAIKS